MFLIFFKCFRSLDYRNEGICFLSDKRCDDVGMACPAVSGMTYCEHYGCHLPKLEFAVPDQSDPVPGRNNVTVTCDDEFLTVDGKSINWYQCLPDGKFNSTIKDCIPGWLLPYLCPK